MTSEEYIRHARGKQVKIIQEELCPLKKEFKKAFADRVHDALLKDTVKTVDDLLEEIDKFLQEQHVEEWSVTIDFRKGSENRLISYGTSPSERDLLCKFEYQVDYIHLVFSKYG